MASTFLDINAVAFSVALSVDADLPRPVVSVDGHVDGADVFYDHHVSGERVNLEAIPANPVRPRSIVTTMLDADAVISAAVLLLRASGLHACVDATYTTLYEAAHWCDWLGSSGKHPGAEAAGLGLFGWLKLTGMQSVREQRAQSLDPAMDLRDIQSTVFGALVRELVRSIRSGQLPHDASWIEGIDAQCRQVERGISRVVGGVTVLELDGYVEPIAWYRVASTPVVLLVRSGEQGCLRYTIGAHPRLGAQLDVREVLRVLARHEPGWGGRPNAGGSPQLHGSRLAVDDVLTAINVCLASTAPT